MQILLHYSDVFASENHVLHKSGKTVCMYVRPKGFKLNFVPSFWLSGSILNCVSSHKYIGVIFNNDMKDDNSISQQRRNLYPKGNVVIRNFSKCTEDEKCQLFRTFCTHFYCSSLWSYYTLESLRSLQVAYNRIFRNLMFLNHRTSMSENLIKHCLNPFKVIVRKSIYSFKSIILIIDNILVL